MTDIDIAQAIYDDNHAAIVAGGGQAEHAFRFALQELLVLVQAEHEDGIGTAHDRAITALKAVSDAMGDMPVESPTCQHGTFTVREQGAQLIRSLMVLVLSHERHADPAAAQARMHRAALDRGQR